MKVIFLDFDGVINNWYQFEGVSIENAIILKKIVDKSDAKIVATTSNKYSLQQCDKIDYYKSNFYNSYVKYLNAWGISIYDLTPMVDKNRSILELTNVQENYLNYPNFSYLATFLPIVNFDVDLLKELLVKENIDVNSNEFYQRLELATNWVTNYGMDYQVNLLNCKNNEYYQTLNELEKEWLKRTIQLLEKEYSTTDELQTALYDVVKDEFLSDKELKQTQKRYFQILYNMLLGREQGPKLGLFLMAINKNKIIYLLSF